MIQLHVKKGVAPEIKAECRRLVDGFKRLSRVGPPLNIIVTPTAVVENPDGSRGFGVCVIPGRPLTERGVNRRATGLYARIGLPAAV